MQVWLTHVCEVDEHVKNGDQDNCKASGPIILHNVQRYGEVHFDIYLLISLVEATECKQYGKKAFSKPIRIRGRIIERGMNVEVARCRRFSFKNA